MGTPAMPIPQTPPPPEQRDAQVATTGEKPDVSQSVMPIANQARDLAQPKPGVNEAQMGATPKAQPDVPSKKRMVLSVLGAAAGLGGMVQAVNQKHNQDQQIRNQHVIDTVWQSHNNESQARNRINQLKPIVEDLEAKMKEAQALPDSDPTKVQRIGYLSHLHQQVVGEVVQSAQTVQASQQNLQAILADPKNRKIVSKAVGYDEKNANAPERQQMMAAIQKSIPGTGPQEAQLESNFPQGPSAGQPALAPNVQEQVLKSATAQAQIEGRQQVADKKAAAPPKETTDTRARADFDKDPNKQPGETFEHWKARQSGEGRVATNRDDRMIAINQKRALGQPLTPEEKAYGAAYSLYIEQTKVQPGVSRAVAFAANRYVPVVDPNNPESVILMRAGDAARAGANTPASIAFNTDKAMTKYMTSGQGGANITAFNTTTEHMKTLQDAANALQNGDVQAFNKLSNTWATATGMPAPTDFNAVKFAVAGELSKTFKGAGATDAEIAQINTTINNAQSPAQIQGAISQYTRLMGGKLSALESQYTMGKQGKPAFKSPGTPAPGKSSEPTPPAGATQVGKDKSGKVVGWMVNGKWVDAK